MKRFLIINTTILLFMLFCSSKLFAQEGFVLEGKVYNRATKQPVDFATIIVLEARVKARSGADGNYRAVITEPGTYTVMVLSEGLKNIKVKITMDGNMTRDFPMNPISIRGAEITITGERDIQKVSRRTLTVEQLKKTPATFGDSINALATLPGVDRAFGDFFGPLVIRGISAEKNRYYIDGMPINDPLHFGGLHSVINNSLMSEIDLYASSFPNEFGGPLGAVININTVDSVKEFGGYTDIGLISTTALIQTPITETVYTGNGTKEENAGYFIASGRYGYWRLFIPYLVEFVTGDRVTLVPEYYDYQVKAKYFLDKNNSLKLLFIGSRDKFVAAFEDDKDRVVDETTDPIYVGGSFDMDLRTRFNNLGLYYDFQHGAISNTMMAYASLTLYEFRVDVEAENLASWMKNYTNDVKPYIFGLKDSFKFEWLKKYAVLRGNIEYMLYRFTVDGYSLLPNTGSINTGGFDPTDDDLFIKKRLKLKFINHTVGGFIDNKFTLGGLTFVPGVRFDYLQRSGETSLDYRGMISYEFEDTGTTVMAAGGKYSSHFQVNPFLFQGNPDVAVMDYALPERAWHSVAGIEQVIGLYTLSVEFYYNYFYDLATAYYHFEDGEERLGLNSGEVKVRGFEVMLRKDLRKGSNDFYGWLSYTYNESKNRSGILGYRYNNDGTLVQPLERYDPTGDRWFRSGFEREHSLKMVAGIIYGGHELGIRFQLYSSFPYTNIVGSEEIPPGSGRYAPVFNETANTEHLPIDHRLDMRYSYKTSYKWGYVTWYIEIINVYGYWKKQVEAQDWYYNRPYKKGVNPEYVESDSDIPFVPNFGVEVKF